MLTQLVKLLPVFALLLFAACDGVSVDPTGMGLQVQFDSTFNGGPASLTFESGYMRLSEIEFEGEKTNGAEIEYEVEQLTTIDLATGQATPALNPILIPAGEYKELELEVQSAEDGGTVVFLEGFFTDSSQNQLPLQLDLQESFSLELEYENYTVDSTLSFSAIFFLDPTVWFNTLTLQDLQQAEKDANGVVVISPDQNADLYDRLVSMLGEGIEWEWED